jgi:hypothetical protein
MKWFLLVPFVLSSAVVAAPVSPVAVYVTSVGAVQDMTDPSKDNRDTVLEASAVLGSFGTAGGFSKAAGKIAKQVREWVTANRVQLEASR